MSTDYELERAGNENKLAFTLTVIFIVLILLTICTLGVRLLSRLIVSRPIPTQEIPPEGLPTDIPTAMPVNNFPVYFPIILSGTLPPSVPVPVPEQIWMVTKIINLGYELNGQRYDLATFQRIDSQETADAYCIDRGLEAPTIGTQYRLNTEGIFVPLDNSRPIQRFLKIQ